MQISESDRIGPTRRPAQRAVMRQAWQDLLFLHWPVDPNVVQATLPAGLTVDTYEGQAYIGLVPFTMRGVRPVWAPSVPGLSNFHECNVRTYVHAGGQNPGVWFYSLDAANPIAVQLARRLFFLPYFYAAMSLTRRGSTVGYHTTRNGAADAFCDVTYTPTGTPYPAQSDTLDFFLAERYLLYAERGNRLYRGQVHHTPYPLQTATVENLDQSLTGKAGFAALNDIPPPLIHYASGVNVDVFPLSIV